MSIIDINDIILGNIELEKNKRIYEDLTDDINKAIAESEGLYNKEHLDLTMSHTEFFEANPLMDNMLSDWWDKGDVRNFKKELFYSMLCETYIPKVPSELTALLVKTREECETPNKMISMLDKSRFNKYIKKQHTDSKTLIKDLLDELWGYKVELVTKDRPVVTNNGVVEIYIENIDEILLCNPPILDILTDVNDIKSLSYSKEKGIVIGDKEIPLRTLIHPFGIVKDDLDLRKVYFVNEPPKDI